MHFLPPLFKTLEHWSLATLSLVPSFVGRVMVILAHTFDVGIVMLIIINLLLVKIRIVLIESAIIQDWALKFLLTQWFASEQMMLAVCCWVMIERWYILFIQSTVLQALLRKSWLPSNLICNVRRSSIYVITKHPRSWQKSGKLMLVYFEFIPCTFARFDATRHLASHCTNTARLSWFLRLHFAFWCWGTKYHHLHNKSTI